jgi:DUF917 family protein
LALGQARLAARAAGRDPVAAAAGQLAGQHIHSGTVDSIQEEEAEGFYFTRACLSGGAELVIKNEIMPWPPGHGVPRSGLHAG